MTLIEAIRANNEKVFFELLNLRVNPLEKRIINEVDVECAGNALYWAAACGHLHFIEPLIRAGANVNKPNSLGRTAVYAAAHSGHAEIITALKAGGADVNTPDDSDTTPVCAAAYGGHAKAITALKVAGANVNAPEVNGLTPIYIAVQMGDITVVNALLEAEANVSTKTPQGTPLELAKRDTTQKGQYIVRLLETHLQQYPNGIKRTAEQLLLTELQKKLVEHCQDEHWYLKRLFDESKTFIEDSYISLSILTRDEDEGQKKQKQLEKVHNAKSDSVFCTIDERIPSHEDLFMHKEPIALSDLFKAQAGEYEPPKRLVVFGRAGIGKSVLCQYLTIRWYQEVLGNPPKSLMQNLEFKEKAEKTPLPWLQNFSLVFWLKLREIPELLEDERNNGSLENIINACCYDGEEDQNILRSIIEKYKEQSLFILDGYDEIEMLLGGTIKYKYKHRLLSVWNSLKNQSNVILTSRPTSNLDFLWPRDKQLRKLELMGFSNEQVENYVQIFMAVKEVSEPHLLTYLKSKPSIWGISHIPINLEMLCWLYCKGSLSKQFKSLSMLYEEIIKSVISEMSKRHLGINEWPKTVSKTVKSKSLIKAAIHFLERLAYQGMLKNELLLSSETIKSSSKAVLASYGINDDKQLTEKLLETSRQLGFLFSTGQGGKSIADQSHYFIHLSFQEHFGARYVASNLISNGEEKENCEHALIQEIQQNKHHPHCQLMWWLTAGLLAYKGLKGNNYNALKVFTHHVFLAFLSQDYMSEMDFKLATHCLDECLGIDECILNKFLSNAEYENLKNKMKKYFSYFIFYEGSNLFQESLETLQRCSNFFSMRPFIDELFFERLIEFSENTIDKKIETWEVLLKIPEYKKQVAVALILFVREKNFYDFESVPEDSCISRQACFKDDFEASLKADTLKMLLKTPEHKKQVVPGLIEFVQDEDESVSEGTPISRQACFAARAADSLKLDALKMLLKTPGYEKEATEELIAFVQDQYFHKACRQEAFESLLKIRGYKEQATEELIAWSQDQSINAFERKRVLKTLLKIPGYEKQAAEELIAWSQDQSINAFERKRVLKTLLKIPGYEKKAAEELIAWSQDQSINAFERKRVLKTLLKIPGYEKKAAESLIAFAQNQSIDTDVEAKSVAIHVRREAFAILLKTSEHAEKALEGLIALAQDKSICAYDKIKILQTLIKVTRYGKQAAIELIALAKDKSVIGYERSHALEILLKMPEHANQAAMELIALAKDKSFSDYERSHALEILLKMPEHANQAAMELIALAKDKSVSDYKRRHVLEILLKMPEHANQAAMELIALAKDKSVSDYERSHALEILLKMPERANQAAMELIALAKDKSVSGYEKSHALEILLKIPEYANQAAMELIALAKDKKIEVDERRKILEIFLKMPEHANQAAMELIALAKDKGIRAYERSQTLEILLKIPNYANQAAIELIALAQDKSADAIGRREALEILLKTSRHTKEVAKISSVLVVPLIYQYSQQTLNRSYQYEDDDIRAILVARLRKYQYEDNDIQAILVARLKQLRTQNPALVKSITILAAVDNIGSSQLETRLRQVSARKYKDAHTFLIPCDLGNAHWVGVLFAFRTDGQIQRVEYIDSLKPVQSISAVPQIFEMQLRAVYPQASFKTRMLLQQSDSASCAAYAIENLLAAALGIPSPEGKSIRALHLEALKRYNPGFYRGFRERQQNNRPTTADLQKQLGYLDTLKGIWFSKPELNRILEIKKCLSQLPIEMQTSLLQAFKPSADEYSLHLDMVRIALQEALKCESKALTELMELLFENWQSENSQTLDKINFRVGYNEILAITKSYLLPKQISNLQLMLTEQIKEDEKLATKLRGELWDYSEASVDLSNDAEQCQVSASNEQTDLAWVDPLTPLRRTKANYSNQSSSAFTKEKQSRVLKERPKPVFRANIGDGL